MHSSLFRIATLTLALLMTTATAAPKAMGLETIAPGQFSHYDAELAPVLEAMTLAEKIGQMTQAEYNQMPSFEDIKELCLGSILSGGGSDPKTTNDLVGWTDGYDDCQKQALSTRLGIPILYGIDAVHGNSNVPGAVIFPHNVGLGCANDPGLVEEVGRITALEVRATGINWNFAPCVTVPRDERWGRAYEGYGEDPGLVTDLGVAMIRGLQGDRLSSDPLRIAACAKHFVGDGGTTAEWRDANWPGFAAGEKMRLDQGDTRVDEATLRRVHLSPYGPAIRAGAPTVMPSYSSWNGLRCSGNKYLLTDVLKGELGFEGFLISDYNAIDQLDDDYKEAIKISCNAGMDMFMVPVQYRRFITLLTELVEEGEVPMERIDDAVRRILRVKAAMGLLDKDGSFLADRSLHEQFGCQEHRDIARRAVRESLVLLKNDGVLPLAKDAKRIHVTGLGADDIGLQCGGWTVEWQGKAGAITTGTTILTAIRGAANDACEITYTADGSGAEDADACVVVVGETPYAEGSGDDGDLELSDNDKAVLAAAQEAGVPTVVLLLSGRPMMVADTIDASNAFIAAWLPGTEGQGVADVLFGDYAPTGKLSVTWTKTLDQLPLNVGDEPYEPLFDYGYGLTYE
ncbi:Periplasmic beta-glucosidase precursor [Pseudobythopirellula maris]|uniref:beta-glucosidase n=1 Tax=Pseudobythopirellula maris TaxID=2527991 RepID=A0A5C5ZIY4_9BACT|nr:glycoside hydrolase family 3 N-terminal domain-containing protein [Pseudobythopirellula maris]TWT87352.1 Periplasmic beta-glucosidase precursor [Pseudobythopirellula maris]